MHRQSRSKNTKMLHTDNANSFLMFFPHENEYSVLPKHSSLWPSGICKEALEEGSEVQFVTEGEEFVGIVVAKGQPEEVNMRKRMLEQPLQDATQMSDSLSTDSISGLMSSTLYCKQPKIAPDVPSSSSAMLLNDMEEPSEPHQPILSDTESSLASITNGIEGHIALALEENAMIQYLKMSIEKQAELAKAIGGLSKEIRGLKKSLTQSPQACHNVNLDNEEKVEYNGTTLNDASYSTVPSVLGLAVARVLWSKEELIEGSLMKKRDSGRRSLSPTRTALFQKMVSVRCGYSPHAIRLAVAAVNQLGLDLKRNLRKRMGNAG